MQDMGDFDLRLPSWLALVMTISRMLGNREEMTAQLADSLDIAAPAYQLEEIPDITMLGITTDELNDKKSRVMK